MLRPFPACRQPARGRPVDWAFWAYAAPGRSAPPAHPDRAGPPDRAKARAKVLVDAHWLQALARAQQRMGFKSGTALADQRRASLSDQLGPDAAGDPAQHRCDQGARRSRGDHRSRAGARRRARLGQAACCRASRSRIFWFNPLVWLLAREAHQLREEAADDAVLAANIDDTEYAKLLVGIARHECRGMLLGAHGVAPGKGSLARRVKRVLDAALERAPGGWKWSSAAAFFAAGMTVPVAALQFVAPTTAFGSGPGSPRRGRVAAGRHGEAPPTPLARCRHG